MEVLHSPAAEVAEAFITGSDDRRRRPMSVTYRDGRSLIEDLRWAGSQERVCVEGVLGL
jgi:hypothetical protein